MILFLSITFTLLNLILWCVLWIRYRKLFSPDDVIERARSEMEHMISDMDRITSRDIDLFNDMEKRLRALIAETDKHIKIAEVEKMNEASAQILREEVNRSVQKSETYKHISQMEQRAFDVYKASGANESTYMLTPEGFAHQARQPVQGNLFASETIQDTEQSQQIDTSMRVVVSQDGAAVGQVPVVSPKVFFTDTPAPAPKKSFDDSVLSLYAQGFSVEDISRELSCSITEVELVLELNR